MRGKGVFCRAQPCALGPHDVHRARQREHLWAADGREGDGAIEPCSSEGGGAGQEGAAALQGRWLTVAAPLGWPAVYVRAAANDTLAELRMRMREAGLRPQPPAAEP